MATDGLFDGDTMGVTNVITPGGGGMTTANVVRGDYRDNEDIGDLADGSDEDDFDFRAERRVQRGVGKFGGGGDLVDLEEEGMMIGGGAASTNHQALLQNQLHHQTYDPDDSTRQFKNNIDY